MGKGDKKQEEVKLEADLTEYVDLKNLSTMVKLLKSLRKKHLK